MGIVAAGLVAGWLVLAVLATLASARDAAPAAPRRSPGRRRRRPCWCWCRSAAPGRCCRASSPALAAQDWPDWRVAFAVESAADPAHPVLARYVAAHPGRATLVVAGPAEGRGQKVQNLLAALRELRPDDAALVTLDADTLPPPGLLRALLRPVLTGQGAIATGYRWSACPRPGAGWAAEALSLIETGDRHPATLARLEHLLGRGDGHRPRRAGPAGPAAPLGPGHVGRPGADPGGPRRRAAGLCAADGAAAEPGGAGCARRAGIRHAAIPAAAAASAGLLAAGRAGRRCCRLLGGAAALAGVAAGDPAALACLGLALLLHGIRIRLRGAIAEAVLPPEAAAEARRVLGRGAWLRPAGRAAGPGRLARQRLRPRDRLGRPRATGSTATGRVTRMRPA